MRAYGSHAAVVLAAGGSRRLGRPKQLLNRAGESLLHRSVRLAAHTGPQHLLVVLGARHRELQDEIAGLPGERWLNPLWEQGLSTSLQLAASALAQHPGPTLILGCDQPALEFAHLLALLDAAQAAPARCAVTRHGQAPGIPAVLTADWLARAPELQGDRGYGALLARVPEQQLAWLDDPALQLDIDDEDDVARAIARGLLDRDA
ncbi:nucleotidyltransferase family protein [Lysobacter silvisoli]|uniref:nucleotidyltransferase family protein n=1 Tax=Lysobacter silvisoli TaxID=2293254 RepID=UPI0018C8AF2A|nr:nucleotidyltransferase family protein [Lysobacter silvisoli]